MNLARVPALVGTTVALAACGGGHATTKQDVIAQANQICATAAGSLRSLTPPSGRSLAGLARYYRRVTPIVESEVKQLRALPRPPQDVALLNRFVAAIERSAADYHALARATRDGDRAAFARASAALRSNPAASLATRYGITECGGSLGTSAS